MKTLICLSQGQKNELITELLKDPRFKSYVRSIFLEVYSEQMKIKTVIDKKYKK